MVSTRLTRRSMTEENMREEAGASHDPQAEIARLNEKVARLERELQERDRTGRQETQEEMSQGDRRNLERDIGHPEGAVGDESEDDSDVELANLLKKGEKVKEKWVEKLAKLEQQCDYLMGSAQTGVKGKALLTDSLFSTAVSPFTERIMSRQLPSKFKMPEIPVYTGLGTPSSTWRVFVRMWRCTLRRMRSHVELFPLLWQGEPGNGLGPCRPARSQTSKALLKSSRPNLWLALSVRSLLNI